MSYLFMYVLIFYFLFLIVMQIVTFLCRRMVCRYSATTLRYHQLQPPLFHLVRPTPRSRCHFMITHLFTELQLYETFNFIFCNGTGHFLQMLIGSKLRHYSTGISFSACKNRFIAKNNHRYVIRFTIFNVVFFLWFCLMVN